MRTRLVVLLVATCLALMGCSSAKDSAQKLGDPAKVLRLAQHKLISTSGVHFVLDTKDLPAGVQGIKAADGTVTDAPAFDGTLTVVISAGQFPVPVVAVDDLVYARVPLTPGFSRVDPKEYGAPDPARLISAHRGVPTLLGATKNPKAGGDTRGGKNNSEVFTSYSGTVPGNVVGNIIPGASGDFTATYEIDNTGVLRAATLTGVFYRGSPSVTYTVTLDQYGTTKDITAP
ncbi:MAG: LppX_LprAFG lipoprotein [Nocardioides sp.]